MLADDTFIYSPFSMHTIWEESSRSLLLQFILTEILIGQTQETPYVAPAIFFPFDWAHEAGALNKIEEHAYLLSYAFPDMEKEIARFKKALNKQCFRQLTQQIKPFITSCKKSKALQYFLEKNKNALEALDE